MNVTMTGQQVFDWAVTCINFGIMFVLFRLVVIIPMQEAAKLRGQRVRLRLEEIAELGADADAQLESFTEKFGNIGQVVAEVKENAERSRKQAKEKIEAKAEAEEKYLLEKAKAEATSLLRETEEAIRTQIASRAVTRAEEILNEVLDASAQNKIVAQAVKKVGGLSAS